jgi:hypothetical protein
LEHALIRSTSLFFCIVLLSCCGWAKEDFSPIPQDEMQLKEVPGAPGAQAAILCYELVQDDVQGTRSLYFRIKILTEEGKKYANVELPEYQPAYHKLDNVRARVVRPDGTIVPFTGKVLDKLVARTKEVKIMTKTFILPGWQHPRVRLHTALGFRVGLRHHFLHPAELVCAQGTLFVDSLAAAHGIVRYLSGNDEGSTEFQGKGDDARRE